MSEVASPQLDRQTESLREAVSRASGARADAALLAQFDAMKGAINDATTVIAESMSVLLDSAALELPSDTAASLEERRKWVSAQVAKMRSEITDDPSRVKQGNTWRETRRAFQTLATELEEARALAYDGLLAKFDGDDQQLLATLPPGTPGTPAYRAAIQDFDQLADRTPRSPQEVTEAAAAGRRLVKLREQVESEAVPSEFQEQWRAVRGDGLPLAEITNEFRAWLDSRGLSGSVVLKTR